LLLNNAGLDDSQRLRACFSALLKRKRTSAGLSQADLAAEAGLEQSYISLLEKGARVPGLDVFLRLSRALKIKPSSLLSEILKAVEAEKRDI
jgi:transcriptional regulator with XRE-family HTH domain